MQPGAAKIEQIKKSFENFGCGALFSELSSIFDMFSTLNMKVFTCGGLHSLILSHMLNMFLAKFGIEQRFEIFGTRCQTKKLGIFTFVFSFIETAHDGSSYSLTGRNVHVYSCGSYNIRRDSSKVCN